MANRKLLTRREFLTIFGLGSGASILANSCSRHSSEFVSVSCPEFTPGSITSSEKQPNIILFYLDDLDEDELAVTQGNVLTPHIDCLANGGIQFDRAYVTSPVCTPSRYSLLTGQFASRCRFLQQRFENSKRANITWNTKLLPGDMTIANILQRNGYTTGMVGKWHLGKNPEQYEQFELPKKAHLNDPNVISILENAYNEMRQDVRDNYGFDYVESFYAENIDGMHKSWGMPKELNFHNTEWITQGALNFIEKSKDQPFFLYFATTLPHSPNLLKALKANSRVTPAGMLDRKPQVQPSRASVFQRVREAGLPEEAAPFTWLDDSIGAVIAKLSELGLGDNTAIFFLSDHQSKGKFTLYEAGAKVPCFLNWKGKVQSGSHSNKLVANIDVAPTILDISNIQSPANITIDGQSWLPILNASESQWRDSLLMEIGYARGIVTNDWKYISVRYPKDIQLEINAKGHQVLGWDGAEGVRYSVDKNFPGYFDNDQLYNLESDPDEQKNLAKSPDYKDLLKNMQSLLDEYQKALAS
jgi:arylsulfatase A-like enzyme